MRDMGYQEVPSPTHEDGTPCNCPSKYPKVRVVDDNDQSGGGIDHSKNDDSDVASDNSGYESETDCSGSDGRTSEETETVAETDAETAAESDADTNGDSSGEEFDRAYDHDNRATMKRILRATRRAIRIMCDLMITDNNEDEAMDYESGDAYQDSDSSNVDEQEEEDGEVEITPLEVL